MFCEPCLEPWVCLRQGLEEAMNSSNLVAGKHLIERIRS